VKPLKIILAIVHFGAGLCAAWAQYSPLPAPGYPGLIVVMRPGVGERIFSGNLGLTNALWSAQSGDTITIGPGTYTITAYKNTTGNLWGGLVLSNVIDVTIFGYGATIKTTNYGTALSIVGCSNVLLSGLTFVGEMTTITNFTNANWTIEGAVWTCSSATRETSAINIENCRFLNQPNQAISFVGGGGYNCNVRQCSFDNIGRTNSFSGGWGPDGACISGVMWGGSVVDCYATNVIFFYEWDGNQGGPNRNCNGLLIAGNTILRAFGYGIVIMPGIQGNSVSGLIVRDNLIIFEPISLATYNWGAARVWMPMVMAYDGFQAGIMIAGSTTNALITGNTIEGISLPGYTNANGFHLGIRDSPNPCHGIRVEANNFRNGLCHAIMTGASGLDNDAVEVVIRNNVFDNIYFPIRPFGGNLTIEGNTFMTWPSTTDYGGNQIACVWITVAANTNLTMRGNMFRSTNAACRTVNKLNDLTLKYLDNDEHGPIYMTTPILSAVTSSNMQFRGWGAAVPTFSCQAGSLFSLTTLSTVGNLYVQTNQVGLNGWRNNAN